MDHIQAFHNVDGCRLHIPSFNTNVTFSSSSDALFASLVAKYSEIIEPTVFRLFDDFLRLLRLEEFGADKLTIQSSFDVLDRIAEENRKVAEEREAKNSLRSYSQKGLEVVVELVADHVEQEVSHVPCQRDCYRDFFDSFDAQDTLRRMSLVHPTWTNIVQRRLRRCVLIQGSNQLLPELMGPRLGPWVRELAILNYDGDFVNGDVPTFFAIVRRCPNVQRIVLQLRNRSGHYPTFPLYREFLLQMKELKYLRWLAFDFVYAMDLWEFCSVLPALRSLERLRMHNWFLLDTTTGDEIPTSMRRIKPSPTLRSLTLTAMMFGQGVLTWLLEPLEAYKPDFLETDVGVIRFITACGPSVISAITRLQINIPNHTEDVLRPNIRRFPSIQTLTVCSTVEDPLPALCDIPLPSPVNSFHFHMEEATARGVTGCQACIMSSSPIFRKLLITYDKLKSKQHDDDFDLEEACADVADACAKRNIEFDFRYSPHFPPFPLSPRDVH